MQRHLFPLQRKRMGSSVSNSTVFILASSSKVCSSDQPDTVPRWSPIHVLANHFVLWQIRLATSEPLKYCSMRMKTKFMILNDELDRKTFAGFGLSSLPNVGAVLHHSAETVLCFRNHVLLFPPHCVVFSEYQQWVKTVGKDVIERAPCASAIIFDINAVERWHSDFLDLINN